jgi:hypothetical protein
VRGLASDEVEKVAVTVDERREGTTYLLPPVEDEQPGVRL